MLTVGLVDDGIGFVPTLTKLKQVVSAHFICMVTSEQFPLGNCNSKQLIAVGSSALSKLVELGCDAVVFSSVALSSRCLKPLTQSNPDLTIFGCDAPVIGTGVYKSCTIPSTA